MPTPTPTPLTRMDVPHNPPSEPLNDRITFNHGIFDAAARSLTEIRAMIEVVHEMMEKQILCSSKDLLKTLASLKQIFRLTDLVLRAYQDTPLLKHISSVISMEAGDCRKLLEDLMVKCPAIFASFPRRSSTSFGITYGLGSAVLALMPLTQSYERAIDGSLYVLSL